jgi:hypothetical protein
VALNLALFFLSKYQIPGMKKYVLSMMLAAFAFSCFAGGKYYVNVKPSHPNNNMVINMGPRPDPKHIWVDGYWVWMPGPARYEWVAGSWKVPPGKYKQWVPGRWKKSPYGWYWVDGHWKK